MKRLRDSTDVVADIDEEIDAWDEDDAFHRDEQQSADENTDETPATTEASDESSDRTVEYIIANDGDTNDMLLSMPASPQQQEEGSGVPPIPVTQKEEILARKQMVQGHMEDMLPLMALMSPEELAPLITTFKQRLDTQYTECQIAVTRRFLALCRDVIVERVLGALAHTEELRFMLAMRTVSKAWRAMVSDVAHVRAQYVKSIVGPKSWVKQINTYYHQFNYPLDDAIGSTANQDDERFTDMIRCHSYLLNELFPRATSLECSLWLTCVPPHMIGLGRVTTLEVRPSDIPYPSAAKHMPSMIGWSHLEALELPAMGGHKMAGLETLTRLTRLQALTSGMVTETVVGALTNLAHLTLSNASARLDLSPLRHLTYMESDQPAHFAGFTGRGVLRANLQEQIVKRLPEHCAKQEDFDRYEPGCFALVCQGGAWSHGRYSGPLDMSYECKDSPARIEEAITGWAKAVVTHNFTGYMVDGQLWGAGQEYMDQEQLFEGEWVQGRRHGPGTLTKRTYHVAIDPSDDKARVGSYSILTKYNNKSQWTMSWLLYSEQEWEQGRLVKETVVGNPALFL
jgi:hypothetical protein